MANTQAEAKFIKSIGGDASGQGDAISVDKIKGTPVSATTPTSGQALVFDGSQWAPAAPTGGPASALGTTGADVVVNTAAPPTTGQVLTATSPTAANWQTPSGGGSVAVPTRQILTSGAGATYTTPLNARQIRIRMVGGGGGGGGFNSSTGNATAGLAGTASSFGGITANPGLGGQSNTTGRVGGAGGVGGGGIASIRFPGNAGGKTSGAGGGSVFGGSPVTGKGPVVGNAVANTGAGGSGGGESGGSFVDSGGGGGSGEYVEIIIDTPLATYVYTIGSGGSGGSEGTVGQSGAGGAGGSGVIIVEEIY